MENNSYSAIHSRFAHSNFILTRVNQSKTCIFRYFLCNGELELIRARHGFSRVYRRSVIIWYEFSYKARSIQVIQCINENEP